MDEYWCKQRSGGQIPAFGNWDFANEMPITQYFESARQAGLIRYSSSSGESTGDHHRDLYSVVDFKKHQHAPPSSNLRKATRNSRERRCPSHVIMVNNKETTTVNNGMIMRKQQGKVYDVTTEHPRKQKKLGVNDAVLQRSPPPPRRAPKPVDEDLYKIPPEELLRTTKRKKMLGFISKCLVPAACVS